MSYPSPACTNTQHGCALFAFVVIIAAAVLCALCAVGDAGTKAQELPHPHTIPHP